MDVFLISDWKKKVEGQARANIETQREGCSKFKTSPQSRCRSSFFFSSSSSLKPDRSYRQTAGNPSQITSTGDHRADQMTEQSRCVRTRRGKCTNERKALTVPLLSIAMSPKNVKALESLFLSLSLFCLYTAMFSGIQFHILIKGI